MYENTVAKQFAMRYFHANEQTNIREITWQAVFMKSKLRFTLHAFQQLPSLSEKAWIGMADC